MSSQVEPKVYSAAHEGAVLVDRSNLGMLKFTGATRLDLLNRMSTQAVNDLKSGEGAATILTTDIGRIIDRLILYTSSEAVYALTSENNADNIARYLMRFVFFNDDFHIEDLSEQTAVLAIYGPQAKAKMVAAGFPDMDLPLHHWRQGEVAGVTAYLHRTDPVAGDGYFVTCEITDKDQLYHHLLESGLALADEAAFEFLRIESGLPRFGREMTQEYIPLEANLWDDVSFSKGCYIGQEIIARMESRGRLAKKMVKLQSAAPIESGTMLESKGKTAGSVTSTAVGPNGVVALGYVKTNMIDSELKVGDTAITVCT